MPRFPALPVLLATWSLGCAAPAGPGPQEATFEPGQRVVRGEQVSVELAEARYDLREVALRVEVSNAGELPLTLDREGVLLAYRGLEYPVSTAASAELGAQTVIEPGRSVTLRLAFVTEQALVEAATLHMLSLRRSDGAWLPPFGLIVPPPAAFVEAADQPDVDEP